MKDLFQEYQELIDAMNEVINSKALRRVKERAFIVLCFAQVGLRELNEKSFEKSLN